jgi:hypothetical protein
MVKSATFGLLSSFAMGQMQGGAQIHRRPMNFRGGVHLHLRERL